ncbi:MAG TPA: FtsX-like permease family protein [Burkholderiaceae bacterium]|nr:FtsX-like permease family protein [Burkholderiaceae bacterium]
MAWRDWRGGELRLLAAALAIAVAAVTSVGFFVDRIRLGLERDAAQLLGGDVAIGADAPIDEALRQRARSAGLAVAETISFPSMALDAARPDMSVLASVKAVSVGYPLRGSVVVQRAEGAREEPATTIPAAGAAWVDPQLLAALKLRVGDSIQLGDARLRIDRLIAIEPDRGAQFANFAPRVMIGLPDLAATGLLQPGSRATYRLLAAGPPAAVRHFVAASQRTLARGQQLESIESGRPDMQRTLERAQRFLAVVALLAALIAAVAVATAASRFSRRHYDACALMRCLGVEQARLMQLFVLEFAWVGIAASAVGTVAGLGLHLVLAQILGAVLQTSLAAPTLVPATQGAACGLVLLFGFGVPPLVRLGGVPPIRVLRRDLGPAGASGMLGYLVGAAAFFLLLLWSAGDLRIGAMVGGGFAAGIAAFAAVGWLLLRAAAVARHAGPSAGGLLGWRYALAAMARRRGATLTQVVALAIGLMALLLLAVVRTDLVDAWRRQVPVDAPNRFVINIQPAQRDAVASLLASGGVDATLYPMVRGRLVERNGRPVGPDDYADERARRLVDREFNLSYADAPAAQSPVVEGRWFAVDGDELSIESGIAKTLGIALGDRLAFDVAGERVEARVTSVRKVQWDSMKVNFFIVMPTRLLVDKPQSFITAFHLPRDRSTLGGELVQKFPNLTVIDTSAILRQVQSVLDQVILAVEFLFVFALAAGLLVLYAALAGSHDERVQETALLRALGARQGQLARAQAAELAAVGAVGGLLAALGAIAVGWVLAHYAFEFDYSPPFAVLAIGVVAGAGCALAGGWLDLRRVLRTPPMRTLREAT